MVISRRAIAAFAVITAVTVQAQVYLTRSPEIASVTARIAGHDSAPPVIMPTAGDRLRVDFDRLGTDNRHLRYRLVHCDPWWRPSDLIDSEFVDGFNEAQADDGEYSRATLTHYVHYSITVPSGITPTISGNYLLEIWDDDDDARPVILSIPFGVSEQTVPIKATVSPRTDRDYLGEHQQLSIDLDLDRIWGELGSPYTDITVTIEQNSRPETRVILTSPTGIYGHRAHYEHMPKLIFKGGNEYRRFETVALRQRGLGIESAGQTPEGYTADVATAMPRSGTPYVYDQTQHGRMLIRSTDTDRHNTEADYADVSFRLVTDPIPGHDIYLEGEMTGRRLDAFSRMKYDFASGAYRLTLPLKQGAYNYQFVALDRRTGQPSEGLIEGDFHQTVNEYTIKVYYRPRTGRGYRLAGMTVITTDR